MTMIPGPSVRPEVASSGRYTPSRVTPAQDATGEQLARFGNALMEGGAALSRRADYQQDMLDDAMTTEADNLFASAVERALHDPKTGYLSKIGREATGDARKQFETDLDKEVERVGKTLTNDVQRQQWTNMVKDRRRRASAQASNHETVQTRNFAIGVTESQQKLARLAGDQNLMLLATRELGGLRGWGDEELKLAELEQNTMMHETNVRTLVAEGKWTSAKDVYEKAKAKGEISKDRWDELDRLVKNAGISDQAARLSAETLKKSGNLVIAEETINKFFEENKQDPTKFPVELRDATIARMRDSANAFQTESDRLDNRLLRDVKERFAAGFDLSPEHQTALETRGLMWQFEALKKRGRNTPYGWRMLSTDSPSFWARFNSEEAVMNHFATELDDDTRPRAVQAWKNWMNAAGLAREKAATQRRQEEDRARAAEERAQAQRDQKQPFTMDFDKHAEKLFGEWSGSPLKKEETQERLDLLKSYKLELFERANKRAADDKRNTGRSEDLVEVNKLMIDEKKDKETFMAQPVAQKVMAPGEAVQIQAARLLREEAGDPTLVPTPKQLEDRIAKIGENVITAQDQHKQLRAEALDRVTKELQGKTDAMGQPLRVTSTRIGIAMDNILQERAKLLTTIEQNGTAHGLELFYNQSLRLLNDPKLQERAALAEKQRTPFLTSLFTGQRGQTKDEFLLETLVKEGKEIADEHLLPEHTLRWHARMMLEFGSRSPKQTEKTDFTSGYGRFYWVTR